MKNVSPPTEIALSIPSAQTLFSVIRGENYSAILANELQCTQPEAVKKLQRLEKAGLLANKREGAAIKYSVVWEGVAALWIKIILENEDEIYVPKRRKTTIFDRAAVRTADSIQSDPAFIEFTRTYLQLVSEFRLNLTLNDIFRWFFPYFVYPNIRIKLAKKDAFELNSRDEIDSAAPFLDFLAGSVSYNDLGRYIAYALMKMFKEKKLKPTSYKTHYKIFYPPFITTYADEEIVHKAILEKLAKSSQKKVDL